ncbi:MAG: tRNA-dihydrouridine synthase, partial [Spirochaetaceae bacterium]|nr:tRNA-dihydrouridine synthase [Spirochaetaceae bacterium]
HANHANWGNNSQIVKDDYLEGTLGFCRKLIDAGVERIALHPRALKQKFKGKADWSFVEALARELPVPVIGNGDVDSGEALAARLEGQTKGLWAGVMVGRAAIKEPWIFSLRASAPPRENIGLKFLDYLSQYQPPEFHLSRAQRFFFYFCDNLKWGNYLKTVINRETSLTGIEKVWKKHFAENEEP